jgi:hypothetical protein
MRLHRTSGLSRESAIGFRILTTKIGHFDRSSLQSELRSGETRFSTENATHHTALFDHLNHCLCANNIIGEDG